MCTTLYNTIKSISNVIFVYDNKANMPAQANAATTQKMNDRQPDTVSVILSMMFMYEFSLMARRRPFCILPSLVLDSI